MRKAIFVVLLGLDLTEEFPVIWLRLRQAINRGAKVIFIGNYAPEISAYLSQTLLHAPGKELEVLKQQLPSITENLKLGKNSAIFIGKQYLSSPNRKAILAQILPLKQNPNTSLNIMEGRGNSIGARYAGMRPDIGPMNQQVKSKGLNAIQVLDAAAKDGWGVLYVAGANPATQFPNKLWSDARAKTKCLIVQDLFLNETAAMADVVMPTLSYVEKGGHFINIEGRLQKLLPGKIIPDGLKSDEDIFARIAEKLNFDLRVDAEFENALTVERIAFTRPKEIQIQDLKADSNNGLRATFVHALFDHGVRMLHDTRLVQMAKEPRLRIHPGDGEKRNIADGGLVQLKANGNVIKGKVQFDERVAEGTVVVPLGFPEIPVHDLDPNLLNGLPVEIFKI